MTVCRLLHPHTQSIFSCFPSIPIDPCQVCEHKLIENRKWENEETENIPTIRRDGFTYEGIPREENEITFNPDLTVRQNIVFNFRIWRPPIAMILISIIQLLIFLKEPLCSSSSLIFDPTKRTQIWRFLTYAFVHSHPVDICTNITTQLVVGLQLETFRVFSGFSNTNNRSNNHELMNSLKVTAVYLVGALAGSLLHSAMEPEKYLSGGSLGVYALIAVYAAVLSVVRVRDIVTIKCGRRKHEESSFCLMFLSMFLVLGFMIGDLMIATRTRVLFLFFDIVIIGLLMYLKIVYPLRLRTGTFRRGKTPTITSLFIIFLTVYFIIAILWQCLGNNIYQNFYQTNYFLSEYDAWNETVCASYNFSMIMLQSYDL